METRKVMEQLKFINSSFMLFNGKSDITRLHQTVFCEFNVWLDMFAPFERLIWRTRIDDKVKVDIRYHQIH